ncbi:MAG: type IV pilus assembly protein PilW [Flavobacteriales bacterium]|jgi:type IV pilus assembly protein PilW
MNVMNVKKHTSGLSLIELLVSMLIAGIIFAGVASVVYSSRIAYSAKNESSFVQENLRYSTDVMAYDIRMAGSTGCANGTTAYVANTLKGAGSGLLGSEFAGMAGFQGFQGFEGGDVGGVASEYGPAVASDSGFTAFPASLNFDSSVVGSAIVGSDAFVVRYGSPDTEVSVERNSSEILSVTSPTNPFKTLDVLMLVDANCYNIAIFQATNVTGNNIEHKAEGSSPGNCTLILKANGEVNCSIIPSCTALSCGVATQTLVKDGSSLMGFTTNAYFIGNSKVDPSIPALKRAIFSSAGVRIDELVQGVEDMELFYGEDTTDDGEVNTFVNADEVVDWDEVYTVKLMIVLRSSSEVFDEAQENPLLDATYNDRFMRKLSSSTIRIRNR